MVNRWSSATCFRTNLLIRPLNPDSLKSGDHLASDGAKVWLRGSVAGQNVLHQKLLHVVLDIWMPHDERGKANGHVESAVFLRGLGTRAQDGINNGENCHESDFRSALD